MNPKATLVLQGQWEFLELFIIRHKSRVNRGGRYLAFRTTVGDKNCHCWDNLWWIWMQIGTNIEEMIGYKMVILLQIGINYLLHIFNFLNFFNLYVKFLKWNNNILRSGFVRNINITHSTKFTKKNKSINLFKVFR